jgi:hypothetical protein
VIKGEQKKGQQQQFWGAEWFGTKLQHGTGLQHVCNNCTGIISQSRFQHGQHGFSKIHQPVVPFCCSIERKIILEQKFNTKLQGNKVETTVVVP